MALGQRQQAKAGTVAVPRTAVLGQLPRYRLGGRRGRCFHPDGSAVVASIEYAHGAPLACARLRFDRRHCGNSRRRGGACRRGNGCAAAQGDGQPRSTSATTSCNWARVAPATACTAMPFDTVIT
jgi:hypothetical protein